jgi:hypothetical protein
VDACSVRFFEEDADVVESRRTSRSPERQRPTARLLDVLTIALTASICDAESRVGFADFTRATVRIMGRKTSRFYGSRRSMS